MIKGAIFDADGVLLDSLGIWKDLGKNYLKKRGISPEEGLGNRLFSMSMEEGAEYLNETYELNEEPGKILEELKEMLRDYYYYEVKAKSGAHEILKFLSEKNIGLVVCTSSPEDLIRGALERNEIMDYFVKIFTTSDVGESKHFPLVYLKGAEYLGTEPSETLVFEDSLYALETVVNAGFAGIGVYDKNGEQNQEKLKKCGEIYLHELKEFINYQWQYENRF